MAKTITRRWPPDAPIGDHQVLCHDCGAQYRRSQLVRQIDGRLSCIGPGTNNDAVGRVEVELDKGNAEGSKQRRGPIVVLDTGNFDDDGPTEAEVTANAALRVTQLEIKH